MIRGDGAVIWIQDSMLILRESGGRPASVQGLMHDITERKKAEETLQMHSHVLESMGEGVVLTDEEGIIMFTNAALDKTFGYERGELTGKMSTSSMPAPRKKANSA